MGLEEIGKQIDLLEAQRYIELEKGLSSSDPATLVKATMFANEEAKKKEGMKAFLYAPDTEIYNANGYRTPIKEVGYRTLRKMARTPFVKTIIGTRIEQVANYVNPTDNEQEKGWMIRKKKVYGEENDEKIVKAITKFFCQGGRDERKWEFDSFDTMLRQITRDSLELDQLCMEMIEDKGGRLSQFVPVDAGTIALVDEASSLEELKPKYGYMPKYVQQWQNRIYCYFYPWEMTFGMRNSSTDIYTNGYSICELEDMVQIVTYLLYGVQYNGNFFVNGSNPKGFFALKGNLGNNALNNFKQMWQNTIKGVGNSYRVPVIESGGADIQWIDMQMKNNEMEWAKWIDFLIGITCAVFKIDPTECGFQLQGSGGRGAGVPFGQDGQKERLKHSESKGLMPILRLIQHVFTKYVVERLDDEYEFVFTGVEQEDEVTALEQDVKKVTNGMMAMEDAFLKWSGRKFVKDKDTILNSVYVQLKGMEMGGGAQGEDEEEDDYDSYEDYEAGSDDYEKAHTNPFESALLKTIANTHNYLSGSEEREKITA
jgi:hypothetical protein